jgi:hypothetical protein
MTLTPTFSGCQNFFSLKLKTEGCSFVFKVTQKVAAGLYWHHVDLACPEGKSIKIEGGTCKAEIKPQTGLTTVTTTNSGSSLTVQWELGLPLVVTQDGIGCAFNGTGTKTASYHGHLVLSRVGGGGISVSGS